MTDTAQRGLHAPQRGHHAPQRGHHAPQRGHLAPQRATPRTAAGRFDGSSTELTVLSTNETGVQTTWALIARTD